MAVEVTTRVTYKHKGVATSYTDGIVIKVKCPKDPHVVQFIYREILDAAGQPRIEKLRTTSGEYETTTDPRNPVWNTDAVGPPNPYYDAGGVSRTDPGELTIFDQPRLETPLGPLQLRKDEISRATFKSFAICDGKVIREVTWVRSAKKGLAPTYAVRVAPADALPSWANDQLLKQGYHTVP
jgi:hypothetical protein